RALAFAAGWVAFEGIRSSGPYAFPWFLLAAAHTRESALPILQTLSIGGQWGLSLAVAYGNGLLSEGFAARRARWAMGALGVVATLGVVGGVRQKFVEVDALSSDVRRVRVALVQGAEDRGTDREAALALYTRLTRTAPRDIDLVVWPEGTVPGDPATRGHLDTLSEEIGAPILAGLIESNADGTLRNAIRLFPETARSIPYAKRQIVPFGEFFPGRAVLGPIFERYGVNYPDFAAGDRPGVFRIGAGDAAFTVGTAICYESAFPYVARDTVRSGADFLVFVTSDQTFDGTVELEQHLDLARMRAVETGRWIVRGASTGITAVLGPDGRTRQSLYGDGDPARLPAGSSGVLVATVDLPMVRGDRNDAMRAGDLVAWLCALGAAAACACAAVRARSSRTGPNQTGRP
ncbi:MAG: apolipoprotein N-acyltransferase, partial [Armatimonadota bacterium]